jgi:glycosyltransferase involved in cell wall biosynthesis
MRDCGPRICLLTETFYPVVGGGETQARLLSEDLAFQGFEVSIITRRSSASLKKIENLGSVIVYRIPPVGKSRFTRWIMLISSLPVLVKLHQKYDIIFVSGFKALGVSAVVASKLLSKVCILKADSNGEMSGAFFTSGLKRLGLTPSSFVIRLFLSVRNNILRRADYFVAISIDIFKEMTDQEVDRRKIVSITNSVDTRIFSSVSEPEKHALRQKLALPSWDNVVIFTGRLVSYKGLPLLLRVWKELWQEYSNMGLVLIGSGGFDIHNCETELRDYVRLNGLQEAVYFAGEVRNVHEYLQASDIYVFPTEKEAFPLALIEAMACGLPVIATPVGGIKEIVTHGHDGLVVEAGNAGQLRDAIRKLLVDGSFAATLGQAAFLTVRNKYSREIVAKRYVELFNLVAHRV